MKSWVFLLVGFAISLQAQPTTPEFFIRLDLDILESNVQQRVVLSTPLLDRLFPTPRARREFASAEELDLLASQAEGWLASCQELQINGFDAEATFHGMKSVATEAVGSEEGLTLMDGANHTLSRTIPLPADGTNGIETLSWQWQSFIDDLVQPGEDLASTTRFKREVVALIRVGDGPQRLHVFRKGEEASTFQYNKSTVPQAGIPPNLISKDHPARKAIAFIGIAALFAGLWLFRSGKGSLKRRIGIGLGLIVISVWSLRFALLNRPVLEPQPTLQTLLESVYAAFDHDDERAVMQQLASLIDGPLLEMVYAEFHRGLQGRGKENRQMKIASVDLKKTEPVGQNRYRCHWTVDGYIGHWSHLHKKVSAQVADYEIASIDGRWKIVGIQSIEQKAVMDETTRLQDTP